VESLEENDISERQIRIPGIAPKPSVSRQTYSLGTPKEKNINTEK
jgi:hypothetical protein